MFEVMHSPLKNKTLFWKHEKLRNQCLHEINRLDYERKTNMRLLERGQMHIERKRDLIDTWKECGQSRDLKSAQGNVMYSQNTLSSGLPGNGTNISPRYAVSAPYRNPVTENSKSQNSKSQSTNASTSSLSQTQSRRIIKFELPRNVKIDLLDAIADELSRQFPEKARKHYGTSRCTVNTESLTPSSDDNVNDLGFERSKDTHQRQVLQAWEDFTVLPSLTGLRHLTDVATRGRNRSKVSTNVTVQSKSQQLEMQQKLQRQKRLQKLIQASMSG